jgi:hydrogenase maturation factor
MIRKVGTREDRAGRSLVAHGGGGQLMDELLAEVIRPRAWTNPAARHGMEDSAVVRRRQRAPASVFTTDGYVVHPLRVSRAATSGGWR